MASILLSLQTSKKENVFLHSFGKNLGEVSDCSLTGHMPIPRPNTLARGSGALIGPSGIMCPLLDVGRVNSIQISLTEQDHCRTGSVFMCMSYLRGSSSEKRFQTDNDQNKKISTLLMLIYVVSSFDA